MLSLGLSSMTEQSIVELSIDIMRAMRDELKESVMLGVLFGDKGVILEQVASSYPVKLFCSKRHAILSTHISRRKVCFGAFARTRTKCNYK